MLFNSVKYVIFLPICVILYFITPQKYRNIFLLIASYYFYMSWVPQYAILIAFSTFTTWISGFLITFAKGKQTRFFALATNIIINLGILFIFKYYDFFTSTIIELLGTSGMTISFPSFSLLLPVGISFYTFQSLGYSIDVYRREIPHETNFIDYALFVSFFPQLVAGPIERSKNLLPQFKEKHTFCPQRAIEGLRIIVFGLFKKVVVADMCALYVDAVFKNVLGYTGITHLVAMFLFAIQIYCDFSGYSDVAVGSAKIFGFNLMTNFNAPYFSTSIAEFWSRWHISLSTWFKDYLYIPLGGNKKGFIRKLTNVFIVFLVSGLWHGANLTFVVWGTLHGIFRIVEETWRKCVKPLTFNYSWCSSVNIVVKTIFCFSFTTFAWVFFRATNISEGFVVVKSILRNYVYVHQIPSACINALNESYTLIKGFMPDVPLIRWLYVVILLVSITLILFTDFKLKYCNQAPYAILSAQSVFVRWLIYYIFIILIMFCFIMTTNEFGQAGAFLYFQF